MTPGDYFLLLVVAVLFVFLVSIFIGVPCLPTHPAQARKMMELAKLKPGMKAVDLGSGHGRLVFLAAQSGATVTGYELNPFLVWWSRMVAKVRGLKNVDIKLKSIYEADLRDVDVVFAFLMDGPMKKLSPKLFSELKPGATIVSYTFSAPGHEPILREQGIWVYKVGEKG
jgi:cyclopropane fatty-acyl-phospholipid synthase-like methyltransferase